MTSPTSGLHKTMLDFDLRPTGKVLFAEDFDLAPATAVPEPEVIEPAFSVAELAAARAEAWQAGADDALAKAAAADHASIRQAVTAMAGQFAAARDELIELAEQSAAAIAHLLLASLGAVLPELTARYGEAEVQAIVRAIIPGLFKEPAVTLRINPRHGAAVARQIEQCDPDLAARLQIVPSETVPPGDLRIAWRNGGATRDAAAVWAAVTETLGLAGLWPQPAGAPEPPPRCEDAAPSPQPEGAISAPQPEAGVSAPQPAGAAAPAPQPASSKELEHAG